MPLQLNVTQAAFMARADQVEELALWVIAAKSNSYAAKLCSDLGIKQTVGPSDRTIETVAAYLKNPRMETGILARLLNSYFQHINK